MPAARRPRLFVLALALSVAAFPLGTMASHDFADVPNSNAFHADISALAASGVTTGCGGGNYCPSAFVTREQMAAFMNRLGALAVGRVPVVNADRLDGLDSTEFLTSDEIVISQSGPLEVDGNYTATVKRYFDSIRLTADTALFAHVPLTKPEVVGGQNYGILAIDICYMASSNLSIDATSVVRATVAGEIAMLVDDTAHSTASGGCHSVSSFAPVAGDGPMVLVLLLNFTGTSTFYLVEVTTHWLPVA